MYAVIQSGGKQYRIEEKKILDLELLEGNAQDEIEFNEVLFVFDGEKTHVGQPFVTGFIIKGRIIGESAGPKVSGLKYRPRERYQKKWGHRQHYTQVEILSIAPKRKEGKHHGT